MPRMKNGTIAAKSHAFPEVLILSSFSHRKSLIDRNEATTIVASIATRAIQFSSRDSFFTRMPCMPLYRWEAGKN